jgi:hypothetical protein
LVTLTAMFDDDRHQQRGPSSGALPIERGTAVLRRDAAIARVGRTRGAVVAGAAGLTGAFYMLASALAPGHTLGATTHPAASGAAAARVSSSGQAVMPSLANPSTLGLQGGGNAPVSPPSSSASGGSNQAVAAAAAPAPAVVSGGS